jgi:hypothetical protein
MERCIPGGANWYGELGDGTSDYRNVPIDITVLFILFGQSIYETRYYSEEITGYIERRLGYTVTEYFFDASLTTRIHCLRCLQKTLLFVLNTFPSKASFLDRIKNLNERRIYMALGRL